ncbi:hypothetical protein Micbo1qcDRAFT_169468 [Microdochium bolleyi]|uniref:Uncharacterized protein n=1 Tax=Microdochium bolleyi TaxID=196109 RepID=A0A136IKV1_9PEZI|nr:hypothetical protein Micbo1qcDRAFT_169468 [Microdochium bolleyi]
MYPSMLELDQKLVMELRDRGKSNFIEPDDVESIVWAFEPLLLALSATVQNAHFKLRNTVTWSSRLFKNLDNALADATSNSRKLILLGTIQTPLSPPEGTPDFDKYRRYINLRMEANRYIRAYPTPEEMEFATNKVGDLRILRECADEFRAEGMSWLAHRPATCDGGLSGRCTLPPSLGNYKEMVIKPIRSSCGKDIRVTEVEDRKGLKCYLPNGKPTGLNPEKHSFHQEYIKPLSDFGEFRIIIARDTSKEAMDGLLPPGKIINIVLTRPNGSSQDRFSDTSVTRFEPACFGSGFGDEEAQKRKSEELRKFALVWYAKLLELSYSYPGLASVQVGLRLDVGLSEVTVDGRFFINEMTRFWSASSYSEGSDTAVQRAWGQAWGFICTQDQYWS